MWRHLPYLSQIGLVVGGVVAVVGVVMVAIVGVVVILVTIVGRE